MENKPKISIIIPLYNKEKSIVNTIDSVLNQTFNDFELIVVNDGSTDNSLSLVRNILDGRIKIFDKFNSGVSSTRNFGVENASAELLFFLDADDYILNNCLEILYSLYIEYPNELIFSANFDVVEYDKNIVSSYCKFTERLVINEPLKAIFKNQLLLRTGNVLINKKYFKSKGGFNTLISYYEDMELFVKICRDINVVYDPQVVLNYKLDDTYLSSKYVPVETDWCYYATIKGKNYYERLIIGDVLYFSLKKRLRDYSFFDVFKIIKNKPCSIIYIFIALMNKKIMGV